MASVHGCALRTLVLAAVLAAAGRAQRTQWSDDCVWNGCRFEPTVSDAVTMDCDYRGMPYLRTTFVPGWLPSSIEEIRISNANRIIIRGALSHLSKLRNIHLVNIGNVSMTETSWSQIQDPEKLNIAINDVESLNLDKGSFSGFSYPGPTIAISDVRSCSIAESAFGPDSVFQSVSLQKIQNLTLEGGTFRASINQLQIADVESLHGCRNNSFSGHIRHLLLTRTAGILHSGCLQADAGWDTLTIQSSRLASIERHGISGSIKHLVIGDSHIGLIRSHGLRLSASTLVINSTEIEELEPDALDVQLNVSASLQRSSLVSVRADAFRRLTARPGAAVAISFQQVVVVRDPEDGCLALAGNLSVSALDIILPNACSCDVHQLALRLALPGGQASSDTSTETSRIGALQATSQLRCTDAATGDTPTLARFICARCPAVRDDAVPQCPVTDRLTGSWSIKAWRLPVTIAVSALGLLLLAAAVLVKRRQIFRFRQTETHHLYEKCRRIGPPQPNRKHADPELRYSRTSRNPTPRQAVANVMNSDPVHHGPNYSHQVQDQDVNPEPVYCELSECAPPAADSRFGEYVAMCRILPGQSGQPVTGDSRQPVYDNCGGQSAQPVYDDCGQSAQPVYDDCDHSA